MLILRTNNDICHIHTHNNIRVQMMFYQFSSLLFLGLLLRTTNSSSFAQFKYEMESVAMEISSKLEQHYKEWCPNDEATCETLTANSCLGVEAKSCDTNFPKPVQCLTEGYFSSNTSNVKFPPDINYNDLSEQEIRFICASAKLETTFQQISTRRNKKIIGMYFGSNRGLFRQFPGNYHGNDKDECDDYDPRYRPWYTIAASGAKNVIILLDKSSSMLGSGKLEIAKTAVLSVIDSLSISDNVGIIAFQNTTQQIGPETLTKMTNDNKLKLQEIVKNILSSNGETNFEVAFKKGLEMIKQAIQTGESGCSQAENVFLLITDGKPTQDAITADSLVNLIKSQIQKDSEIKRDIIIFAYALGENMNTQFLKTLTCNFRGIVILESEISVSQKSSSAIATKLREFYTYLSVGVKFLRPVWTQPYTDYYEYGRMVTVSMPAYYVDPITNLSTMLGVTGVDIMMQQFDIYGFSEQEVINQLIGESACQKNQITDCQLQALRISDYQCNVSNCIIQEDVEHCSKIPPTSEIFKNVVLYKDDLKCCGLTTTQFIIIIVTVTTAFFFFIGCFCLRKRIYRKFCDRSYRHIRNNSKQTMREGSAESKRGLVTDVIENNQENKYSLEIRSATHLRNFSG